MRSFAHRSLSAAAQSRLRPKLTLPPPPPTGSPPFQRPGAGSIVLGLGVVATGVGAYRYFTKPILRDDDAPDPTLSSSSSSSSSSSTTVSKAIQAAQAAMVSDVMSKPPPPPTFTGLTAPQPAVQALSASSSTSTTSASPSSSSPSAVAVFQTSPWPTWIESRDDFVRRVTGLSSEDPNVSVTVGVSPSMWTDTATRTGDAVLGAPVTDTPAGSDSVVVVVVGPDADAVQSTAESCAITVTGPWLSTVAGLPTVHVADLPSGDKQDGRSLSDVAHPCGGSFLSLSDAGAVQADRVGVSVPVSGDKALTLAPNHTTDTVYIPSAGQLSRFNNQ